MCAHAQRTGIQIGPGKTTQLWLRPARLFLSNSEFPVCSTPLVFFFVSSRLMKSTGFQPDFWGFPPNNPVSVAPQPSVLSLVVKEVLFLFFTEGTTVWEPISASISLFLSRSFSLPTRFPSLFCFGVYHTVVGRPVCQPGCGWLAFGGLWSGPRAVGDAEWALASVPFVVSAPPLASPRATIQQPFYPTLNKHLCHPNLLVRQSHASWS